MPASKTPTVKSLESLGAPRLARLLIEICGNSPHLKRRLKMALASEQKDGSLKKQIQKRLGELRRASSYIERHQAKDFIQEISALHRLISVDLVKQSPRDAIDMLWKFIDIAGPCYERYDDSRGKLGQIFREALDDMGEIAQSAKRDPKALSAQMVPAIRKNGYGEYDGLIPTLARALGSQGLIYLRGLIEEHPKGKNTYWKKTSLQQIADALGDVEAYRDQFSTDLQRQPRVAAEIAVRLIGANRAQEALELLDNVDEIPDLDKAKVSGRYVDLSWHQVRISALTALRRDDEAQALRWSTFKATLNGRLLEDYLAKLEGFEDVEARDRAAEHAAAFSDIHLALQFLIHQPNLDFATQMIIQRFSEIDGRHYELIGAAIRKLEARHLLPAALLRRALIDFALQNGRSKRYKHAARHLLACSSLDTSITDYDAFIDHHAYEQALREQHGRKTSFWKIVDS